MAARLMVEFLFCLNLFFFYANAIVQRPEIDPETTDYAIVGEEVYLICRVGESKEKSEDEKGIRLLWSIPETADNSTGRFITEDIRTDIDKSPNGIREGNLKNLTTKLTIQNVTKLDEGEYTCISKYTYNNYSSSDMKYIKVYSKDESLTVESEVIEVEAGKAEWVLNSFIRRKTNFTLTWLGLNGSKIAEVSCSWSNDKYDVDIRHNEIILTIENVIVTDTGSYTVIVENGEDRKTLLLQLFVLGKPEIQKQIHDWFYQIHDPKNISCVAIGNPLPQMWWSFQRCNERDDWIGCHLAVEQPITDRYYETKKLGEYMIESSIELDMKESGILKCFVNNSIGNDTERIIIRVKNLLEGIKFYQNKNEIIVGDDVVLTCETNINDCGVIDYIIKKDEESKPAMFFTKLFMENVYNLDIINISKTYSGRWVCQTRSDEDRVLCEKEQTIIVLDLEPPKIIETNFPNSSKIVITSFPFSLNCTATGVPSPTILWYKDGELISSGRLDYELSNNDQSLIIRNQTIHVEGLYRCQIFNTEGIQEAFVTVKVKEQQPPKNIQTNFLNNTEIKIMNVPYWLNCAATGVPFPTILWYKDEELISSGLYYELLHDNHTLNIRNLTKDVEGYYRCKAFNKEGSQEAYVTVKIQEQFESNMLLVLFCVVSILLIFCLSILIYCICKKIRMEKAAKLNFIIGAPESINPDLPLDDQTDLLPYDPKWEFPRKKLVYGKQLGAGAFGVVMKAEAFGIVKKNQSTTVAVKMVKRHADPIYVQALASELKIMIHLGKHLNVVNLLGACTKNLYKQKLLVIVEFCTFGNLHAYLVNHRDGFINQIDPNTGEIDVDYSDDQHILSNAYSDESLENTEISNLQFKKENMNNPEWCANLEGDYQNRNIGKLTTSTLVCWAFQIARGMEYLASKRVVHGDLAARNVLLTDHNVVKICDFGLAKNIYKNPNYRRKTNFPLPVHWMALECVEDGLYSTESDVWSYGIVLWELFSLGKRPYSEFDDFSQVREKLMEGYRMSCPLYANQFLHDTMLECWSEHLSRRPSFMELTLRLGNLLEKNVREHYIELNSNFQNSTLEDDDYLIPVGNTAHSKRYVDTPTRNKGTLDKLTSENSESLEMTCPPMSAETHEEMEKKLMLTESTDVGYLIPEATAMSGSSHEVKIKNFSIGAL